MVYRFTLDSTMHTQMIDITDKVREIVSESGVLDGICTIFIPHTTAAVTINENADPDVQTDLLFALDKTYPDRPQFRHMEGNSAAHLRSSCVGASETVIIEDGSLLLGTWQGIYFAEFDGPRLRTFYVKIIKG